MSRTLEICEPMWKCSSFSAVPSRRRLALRQVSSWRGDRPNLALSPPVFCHLPAPRVARRMRTPRRGSTPKLGMRDGGRGRTAWTTEATWPAPPASQRRRAPGSAAAGRTAIRPGRARTARCAGELRFDSQPRSISRMENWIGSATTSASTKPAAARAFRQASAEPSGAHGSSRSTPTLRRTRGTIVPPAGNPPPSSRRPSGRPLGGAGATRAALPRPECK